MKVEAAAQNFAVELTDLVAPCCALCAECASLLP